jgi:hypothetical protein
MSHKSNTYYSVVKANKEYRREEEGEKKKSEALKSKFSFLKLKWQ